MLRIDPEQPEKFYDPVRDRKNLILAVVILSLVAVVGGVFVWIGAVFPYTDL